MFKRIIAALGTGSKRKPSGSLPCHQHKRVYTKPVAPQEISCKARPALVEIAPESYSNLFFPSSKSLIPIQEEDFAIPSYYHRFE